MGVIDFSKTSPRRLAYMFRAMQREELPLPDLQRERGQLRNKILELSQMCDFLAVEKHNSSKKGSKSEIERLKKIKKKIMHLTSKLN